MSVCLRIATRRGMERNRREEGEIGRKHELRSEKKRLRNNLNYDKGDRNTDGGKKS